VMETSIKEKVAQKRFFKERIAEKDEGKARIKKQNSNFFKTSGKKKKGKEKNCVENAGQ